MPAQAVVAGHICLDLMPGLGARALELRPGALRIAGPLTIATGGSVSNTGIALHRLGIVTRLVALVGDDPLAGVLRGSLEAESPGLASGLRERAGEGTSYSVILSTASTDRIVVHYPGANDAFAALDVADEALAGAELLHVGYPPLMRRLCEADGAELVTLLQRAHAAGPVTSLDMAEPDERLGEIDWRAFLEAVLRHVDVFLPSLGELRLMLRGRGWDGETAPSEDELCALAEESIGLGAAVVGIKLGRFGLYVRTGVRPRLAELAARIDGLCPIAWSERELWSPIFEVPVLGTTGSGDATIAGFLAAMLRREPPDVAANLACAVGSLCVEADDALSGIAGREAADERARSSVARPRPPVSGDWRASSAPGVLAGARDLRAEGAPA